MPLCLSAFSHHNYNDEKEYLAGSLSQTPCGMWGEACVSGEDGCLILINPPRGDRTCILTTTSSYDS
jgi:hypothetical protein